MTAPRATYEVDGAAIRRLRMARGIQMADLARTARITPSYLSRLETGVRRQMRPPTYTALRTALGVEADDDQLLAPSEPNTE
ncbi:helix-turn-helix domain-containing protein [Streptomyces kebangsaanensis]|uniref:helix-turn-helix domain-containing protein n=1 Tax=Streptomyces kebangsaanensis TaxID=864058 RepID=UPI00093EF896|nr:helix-turn-helix transcriptional regulator [Streptomyces kebangsaanensis]